MLLFNRTGKLLQYLRQPTFASGLVVSLIPHYKIPYCLFQYAPCLSSAGEDADFLLWCANFSLCVLAHWQVSLIIKDSHSVFLRKTTVRVNGVRQIELAFIS